MSVAPVPGEPLFSYELRVRITDEMRLALRQQAQERQTSMPSVVRYALLQWLHAQAKRAAS